MYCDGLRVLAGCSHTYTKPLPALDNNDHPPFHLNGSHSSPVRPLRFWLGWKCWPIQEWFYIQPGCDTCTVMVRECWQGVPIPITSLYKLWVTMVRRPSTSMHLLTPISPLRFCLELKCLPIPESGSTSAQVMPYVL